MTSNAKRTAGRRQKIAALRKAQRERCGACGGRVPPLDVYCAPVNRPTLDHVIPRAAGGKGILGNLLVMHQRCNALKADRRPTGCELLMLAAANARLGL